MAAVTQAAMVVGVGAGASATTLSSTSSPQGMWALINQYQLFLLFPYLRTYIPADFEKYLTDFELFNMDFDFIDLFEIPWVELNAFKLNYTQTDSLFFNNGNESGSFVINHFNLFKAIMILMGFNLVFIVSYIIFRKCRKSKK